MSFWRRTKKIELTDYAALPVEEFIKETGIPLYKKEEGTWKTEDDIVWVHTNTDDGEVSGTWKGFGTRHLNCRTYMKIDYDFSALMAEGISQAGSKVTYTLAPDGIGKTVQVADALVYPDADLYRADYPAARENRGRRYNWQGDTGTLRTDRVVK